MDIQQYLPFCIVKLKTLIYLLYQIIGTTVTKHSAFWCHLCNTYTWCPIYMGTFWFLLRKTLHQSPHHRQLDYLCLLLWTFCLKNWPRAWWLMILITKRVFCWDGACLLLQLIELRKFVAYLQLIVPFQYALRYQLIFTCFNFLPCCFDNSRYLIGSQKPIRRKSSTCLNYLATRENHQRICKKKYLRMRN